MDELLEEKVVCSQESEELEASEQDSSSEDSSKVHTGLQIFVWVVIAVSLALIVIQGVLAIAEMLK